MSIRSLIFTIFCVVAPSLAIGQSQPVQPSTAAASSNADGLEFYRQITVKDYDRIGQRNEKWDADVRLMLEALARQLALQTVNSGDDVDQIMLLGRRVRDAGCTDPLMLFAVARSYQAFGRTLDDTTPIFVETAKRMAESPYHPLLKCLANLPAAAMRARDRSDPVASRRDGRRMIEAAMAALPRTLADADVPPTAVLLVYEQIGDASRFVERDRELLFKTAIPQLEAAFHDRLAIPLAARAQFALDSAIDARRDSSLSPEEAKQVKAHRLAEALALGEQAIKLDPTNARIAELLMDIETERQGAGESVRHWFSVAAKYDPHPYNAYSRYLSELDNGTTDSARSMIELGQQALATNDWKEGTPLLLVDAHLRASYYVGGKRADTAQQAYFKAAEPWEQIRGVFEKYLELNPEAIYQRSRFAQLATWHGSWEIADQQCQILGNRFSMMWFRGKDDWNRLRGEVAARNSNQK